MWLLEDSPDEALLSHPLTQERPTQLSKVDMAHFTAEESKAQSRERLPQVHQAEPWVSDSPGRSWPWMTQYSAQEHKEGIQALLRTAGSLPSRDPKPLNLPWLTGHWAEMPPCPSLHPSPCGLFNLKSLHPEKSPANWPELGALSSSPLGLACPQGLGPMGKSPNSHAAPFLSVGKRVS